MSSSLPSHVTLVDVGPRDGLQNEAQPIPAATKIELVGRLQGAGLREIEVTSYVSPKWVPQMADAAEVMAGIARRPGVRYSVLTPNLKGLEAALAGRPDEVVVFGAASEAFSRRNINCSIEESIERFRPVVQLALAQGIKVRAAVSCAVGCPYQGDVRADEVERVVVGMKALGVQHCGIADTIGVGTPRKVQAAMERALKDTSTTPTAKPWPISTPAWRWACTSSTPAWPDWAAAPMPRARRATWPPRTWSSCSTAWASTPASTWTPWPARGPGSRRNWAGRPSPGWAARSWRAGRALDSESAHVVCP